MSKNPTIETVRKLTINKEVEDEVEKLIAESGM